MRRFAMAVLSAVLTAVSAVGFAHPADRQVNYELTIPDRRSVTYELPLDLLYPGEVVVSAEWPGSRSLSFRIESADAASSLARRSGPSPQILQTHVGPDELDGGPWILKIHALAAGGEAAGRLTVSVPGPPEPVPAPTSTVASAVGAPVTSVPEWARSASVPHGSPAATAALYRRTERLRSLIVDDPDGTPDSCRWQDDTLRWLVERRTALSDGGRRPARPTRKILQRMADAVRAVEELRTSDDPMLAGPGPEDPVRREAWNRTRKARLEGLESELDDVIHRIRNGHAPELENEGWPTRLMVCATACERFFEQRPRLGEDGSVNRDLARDQWRRILAAAEALDALAAAEPWVGSAASMSAAAPSGGHSGDGLE